MPGEGPQGHAHGGCWGHPGLEADRGHPDPGTPGSHRVFSWGIFDPNRMLGPNLWYQQSLGSGGGSSWTRALALTAGNPRLLALGPPPSWSQVTPALWRTMAAQGGG